MPQNLWNDSDYQKLPAIEGLVYRSNLLGADRAVVNIFGGNTSAKLTETDHMGRDVTVLWVKGSGSDVATIKEGGFAGLRQDEITPLMSRDAMTDEEMVAYLSHTTFAQGRPRQSIETLLHAFVPARHVDHTHPDAVISLACAEGGRELCQQLWGERMVWVDYIRPGFTLSKWIGEGVRANPKADLVVMGKHGLVTWHDECRPCYDQSIKVIQEAEEFIESRRNGRVLFPGTDVPALAADERNALLAQVLPVVRGLVGQEQSAILCVDDSQAVLDFVGTADADQLSQVGAACPDHLVHTKRQPLFVDWKPTGDAGIDPDSLRAALNKGVTQFIDEYKRYFARCQSDGDELRDPAPRVILIPGLGMINTGATAFHADVSRQLYHRAIAVAGGSTALSKFDSLTEQEAFDIEYWPLELYKLSLKPPPAEQDGRVAVVTGAASGIGRAIARRLAQDGAHIAILDINLEGAQTVAAELIEKHGPGRAIAVRCDVTSEDAVAKAFSEVVLAYGGVDVVVNNAGIAFSAPIEETSMADWERTMSILNTGYFLIAREAFKNWKPQGVGGSLICIASKNAVFAGKNASVYSAAKASELHMARCLAEEGGAFGIRVNSVLPDGVLQDSGIWEGGWREARAASYGLEPDQLDDYYRQRTTLKVNIFPEDIAEAVSFFAGPRSSRTTGGALTVDGGVAGAYMR